MTKFDPLFDHTITWMCYRSNFTNLIYFPCIKSASTLYNLLFENLNWKKITISEINWEEDFVFSHIRQPLIRHRKGIVEGITYKFPYMMDVFVGNVENLKFLANLTTVDPHSYTIHRMIGDNALKMHWIPIDTELDHKQKTFELLLDHDDIIDTQTMDWFRMLGVINPSTEEETTLYNQLSAILTPPEITRYIDFDVCLYDQVVATEPHIKAGQSYQLRITQLLGQGLSQAQAEEIADLEVTNDEYLKWRFNA